ncbi:SUKH superfamily protein [Streptomyces sp. 840.1]|uniref:SMI1/KNR4 family protein n=1 Tax=Streptomyces sp. 840.1 TaxID=2485152 RepID=UPI000F49BA50|nr:SMI1/KNR4 family protein [Streptomyces sp. 840.1]ROQ68659.1 SUKH superfamily protein [Streptomyces sp. 840.1]
MTAFDDLTRLVPPPSQPRWGTGDWDGVEAALALELPSEFKRLAETYGAYHFSEFLTPLAPFGRRDLLVGPAKRLLDQERGFRKRNPEKCPYPFYPEPGGLLPWAGTDNGDRVCWLTDGKPDEWTVVCWNPRGWYYDAHPVGAVEFLVGWLSGDISTGVFPDAAEFAGDDEDDSEESAATGH